MKTEAAYQGHPPTVGALFADEPEQWGLRGDPHAWAALRDHVNATPLPDDAASLTRTLKEAFVHVVGVDLDDPRAPEATYCEEFAHGGMSSGHVHLPTWRERLIPLLVSRADNEPPDAPIRNRGSKQRRPS